ncbi:MAG: permease [Chloroflexi bacterium]|nr:permease [Chloroflexota bacterium]
MLATELAKKRLTGVILLAIILGLFLAFNRYPKIDIIGEDLGAVTNSSRQCFQSFCIDRDEGSGFLREWVSFSVSYLQLVTVGMTFAFLTAGLADAFLFPKRTGAGFISGGRIKRTLLGAAMGPVLNLCSACIVPVSAAFKKRAGLEGAISMVQSSATMNLPALIMVFFVFTPILGASRVLLAVLGALLIGPLVAMTVRQKRAPNVEIPLPAESEEETDWQTALVSGFRQWAKSSIGYFVRMAPLMIAAGFISGLVIQWLSPDTVAEYLGNDALGVIIAATFGILINVPLLFEIPLVALLLLLGMGTAPAAALLFTAAAGGPVTFWGMARLMPRRSIATFAGATWTLGAIGGLIVLAGSTFIWDDGGLGERVAAANTCDQIDVLQKGVLYETLSIEEIRLSLDAISDDLDANDEPMRSAGKRFVGWAREIAHGGFYDYPTFGVMNYLETYEQMELHVQVDGALRRVGDLCEWGSTIADDTGYASTTLSDGEDKIAVGGSSTGFTGSTRSPGLARLPTDASVRSAEDAREAVVNFLGEQSWGFFGASCAMWLDFDYRWERDGTFYSEDESRWLVKYTQNDGRIVGLPVLAFRVDPVTGEVKGDNKIEGDRAGISEHCDEF